MDEHDTGSLGERVGRLESELGELRTELRYALRRVNRLLAEREAGPPTPGAAEQVAPPRPGESPAVLSRGVSGGGAFGETRRLGLHLDLWRLRSGEWWLTKIGIGLLLLGGASLFMLAVERGWIGPSVRVGFDLAVGGALPALGLRVGEHRRASLGCCSGAARGAVHERLRRLPAVRARLLPGRLRLHDRRHPPCVLSCAAPERCDAVPDRGCGKLPLLGQPSSGERQALQAGVAFAWLLFWLALVVRGAFVRELRGPVGGLAYAFVVSAPLSRSRSPASSGSSRPQS